MTPASAERAARMVARVERSFEEAGLASEVAAPLLTLARDRMRQRVEAIPDPHHPLLLHPLRAVLVLLEAGVTDQRAVALVLRLDTEVAVDVPGPSPWGEVGDEEIAGHLAALAEPEARLEHLVASPTWVASAWLAERLDHLRHLHLWAGPRRTHDALENARIEEAALAHRLGGRLDRAYRDWLDKAARYRLAERARVSVAGVRAER